MCRPTLGETASSRREPGADGGECGNGLSGQVLLGEPPVSLRTPELGQQE